MFIEALFTIKKGRSLPPMGEWRSKRWYTPMMEYYSALKRKDFMAHAKTWMYLEDSTVSEISQFALCKLVLKIQLYK
jgi:hypothetical protein